jgi:hypothetical protein
MSTLGRLRAHAISHSLFPQTTLSAAFRRLGFVQADPIRSPARAQDLILRHRVRGYRAGELERRYPELEVEEDVLYAYGFLPRDVWHLVHPRKLRAMSTFERRVLSAVHEAGVVHPRDLDERFGRRRVINAWSGYSQATTRALEFLRHRGRVRVARRENGIRLYAPVLPLADPLPAAERLTQLILRIADVLAPIPEKTFHAQTASYRGMGSPRTVISELLKTGELETERIDGVTYVWPHGKTPIREAPRRVRFLAPFDPVVWDRRRFEHLWGWPYRFEAYTPPAKRLRGYYAMPLLWRDAIVGWANAGVEGARLNVELGFVNQRPRDADFRSELDVEIDRLKTFLRLE